MLLVTVTTSLEVPTVPNFIKTQIGESVPIKDLTHEQMEAIGKAWTEALIEKSRRANEADKKPPGDWGIKVPA